MGIKPIICFFAAVMMCIGLCGCDLFTVDTEQLLTPPELTGDMKPIQQALANSVNGQYTLKYPSTGEWRSAVILEDVNGDNVFEAFALYSTTDGDTVSMHINVICSLDGKWKSAGDQKITAGGVDRIDFCDLDGDGVKEILVGWEIYGSSEKQLAVYSFTNQKFTQRMLQQYTSFLCCDLDENGENEIFIQLFSATDSANRASICKLESSGVTEVSGCLLDGSVKTVNAPVLGTLSSGQPAVYVDEIKGAGAITEVLFVAKGELVNPLLDADTRENIRTLRTSSLFCTDINNDGVLEIPVAEALPVAETARMGDKLYYTKWSSYNGETLTCKLTAVMNQVDGYYINVPEKWLGHIAILRDTEKQARTIYAFDPETGMTGERLAYIQAVTSKEWDGGKYDGLDLTVISRSASTVYVGWTGEGQTPLSVTTDDFKKMFFLIK